MKTYRGGEEAGKGTYLNLSGWELVRRDNGSFLLPGSARTKYLKIPGPLAMILGPFAGLAFIVFIPFIAVVALPVFLARRIGLGINAQVRKARPPRVTSKT